MSRGTTLRSVRIGDDLWSAAQTVAAHRGETLSDVVRRSLERYVKRHDITPPPDRQQRAGS